MKILIIMLLLQIAKMGHAKNIFDTNLHIVQTKNGKVSGLESQSLFNDKFYAFKGIPYAKPPIGHLRFQDPDPVDSWEGVKDATNSGPICPQISAENTVEGSEDCLYLNVYTKSIQNNTKNSVFVYIHGGGWVYGTGDISAYGPDYFLRKDIVLVTLNYRLAVFGFLNLEDEVATGNQALKDQLMALQWIQANILNFGGNPDDVTICGESAGAASVNYLTLSPLAKGLFHKAIFQSGVAINSWALPQKNAKETVYNMCDRLEFKSRDSKEIIEFLKTVNTEKLIRLQNELLTFEENIQIKRVFGPAIDTKSKNPFMPVDPREIAEKGIEVPLLIGNVDVEAVPFLLVSGNEPSIFNDDFEKWIDPFALEMLKNYNMTANDVKRMYFGEEEIITNENYEKLVYLVGDLYFVEGAHQVIKTQVINSSKPIFFYHFSYDKGYSSVKSSVNVTIKGSYHTDELPFLFPTYTDEMVIGDLQKGTLNFTVMDRLTDMWANFAITGSPTTYLVNWEPVKNATLFNYLDINDNLQTKNMLSLEERYLQYKHVTNLL